MEDRQFNDASYRQFLSEEKLMGSKCKRCGALSAPPRSICIECHGTEMQWSEMKGDGRLAAFTCIAIGPPSMAAEGYSREHPYISGVVELAEGARVDARIEGIDGSHPEAIKIGLPVVVKFLHRGEGDEAKTYLAFQPL
jgi:uncharacterized OB-fold protein